MLSTFTDIAPKAAVAALLVWGGSNYLVIGPEIASRVARADHMPVCEAGFRETIAKAGQERISSLPAPAVDPSREMAAAQLNRLQNNPFMSQLRGGGMGDLFGIGDMTNLAIRQYEEGKEAAREAYERSIERIKQETATNLAASGEVCGCIADAAIAETRTEWAIFSGTLSLIRPASLKSFDEKMGQIARAGACDAAKAGA